MMAYFCYHLSDNYVDLSDDADDVDLRTTMSICQKRIINTSC